MIISSTVLSRAESSSASLWRCASPSFVDVDTVSFPESEQLNLRPGAANRTTSDYRLGLCGLNVTDVTREAVAAAKERLTTVTSNTTIILYRLTI